MRYLVSRVTGQIVRTGICNDPQDAIIQMNGDEDVWLVPDAFMEWPLAMDDLAVAQGKLQLVTGASPGKGEGTLLIDAFELATEYYANAHEKGFLTNG